MPNYLSSLTVGLWRTASVFLFALSSCLGGLSCQGPAAVDLADLDLLTAFLSQSGTSKYFLFQFTVLPFLLFQPLHDYHICRDEVKHPIITAFDTSVRIIKLIPSTVPAIFYFHLLSSLRIEKFSFVDYSRPTAPP